MKLIYPSYEIITDIGGDTILRILEGAGRTCYKSETLITNDSAKKFVEKIIKNGHYSVLEHENISVRFICDRGVTHELVRHRLAAYSQESTRYCNYKNEVTFIIPPWVNIEPKVLDSPNILLSFILDGIKTGDVDAPRTWLQSIASSEVNYTTIINKGWSPQQARSILPNSLKTEIVMTANLREWRHVFNLRTSKAAHPQIREIMIPLLLELRKLLPIIFDDVGDIDWKYRKWWELND